MAKILFIEDDQAIADLVVEGLTLEGHAVTWVHDGARGITAACTQPFDLVLLDVMLPDINGFSVCQAIRGQRQMPILMLTARGAEEDQIQGLGVGADDYITKPFSMATLIARIEAHLRRSRLLPSPEGLVQIGDLEIDPIACQVSRGGQPINLTAKEFELLLYLSRHPNRVFTRAQLYEAIWKEPAYGDGNTVMVHVSRLREKIETDKGPTYIETLRGLGYRFLPQAKW